MLSKFKYAVDRAEFRKLVLKEFPDIAEEIQDCEELLHMEMSTLETLANNCIQSGHFDNLKKIYKFVNDLAQYQEKLEPDVMNAINVSFLEGLDFDNQKNGQQAKKMLPSVLLLMWEAQMKHNREIGWF